MREQILFTECCIFLAWRSGGDFFSSSRRFHLDVIAAIYHCGMRCVVINFLLVSIMQGLAAAQGPHPNRCPRVEEQYQRLLWSGAVQSQVATQIAKRTEAQAKERQFLLKAERLVQSWTALAHEYNEKGTFNVKKAGEVSKAFHDLEKTEGWPRSNHR